MCNMYMNYAKPVFPLLMMTKLRNRILKIMPEGKFYLEFKLHNIKVNESKRGCYGFIRNSVNGNIVYVNTEAIWCGYLRRYAKSMTDYTGEFNHFSKNEDQFALDVVSMLKNDR